VLRERSAVELAVQAEFPPFPDEVSREDPRAVNVDLADGAAQRLGAALSCGFPASNCDRPD